MRRGARKGRRSWSWSSGSPLPDQFEFSHEVPEDIEVPVALDRAEVGHGPELVDPLQEIAELDLGEARRGGIDPVEQVPVVVEPAGHARELSQLDVERRGPFLELEQRHVVTDPTGEDPPALLEFDRAGDLVDHAEPRG